METNAALPVPRLPFSRRLLVALFLLAIGLPPLGWLFGFGVDTSATTPENRTLAAAPPLTLNRASLATFPKKFESYWNDAFGFRGGFIYWHNRIKLALGVSPSRSVVLGRDGWLYLRSDDSTGDYTDGFRAVSPFTDAQLQAWQRLLESRRDWLAARGIRYLYVAAPNKETIYPEHMPTAFNRVSTQTRLDQLVAHMRAHSDVDVLDLRTVLHEAKAIQPVYHRLDTHWNDLGAWTAYSAIMDRLTPWFPALQPLPLSAFELRWTDRGGADLAGMLAMQDVMHESQPELRPKIPREAQEVSGANGLPEGIWGGSVFERPGSGLPRALVFYDSFGLRLRPFLSEHFSRVMYLWQEGMDRTLIEREHPDVVIHERVERFLAYPVPGDW